MKFKVKEFKEWWKKKHGDCVFMGDVEEYYIEVLGKEVLLSESNKRDVKRFEYIVAKTLD